MPGDLKDTDQRKQTEPGWRRLSAHADRPADHDNGDKRRERADHGDSLEPRLFDNAWAAPNHITRSQSLGADKLGDIGGTRQPLLPKRQILSRKRE